MNIRTLRKVAPDWVWERVREYASTQYYGRNAVDGRTVVVWRLDRRWIVKQFHKNHQSIVGSVDQWVAEENLAKRAKK